MAVRTQAELNAAVCDAMRQFAEACQVSGMRAAEYEAQAMAVLCKMQAVLLSNRPREVRASMLARIAEVVVAEAEAFNSRVMRAGSSIQ